MSNLAIGLDVGSVKIAAGVVDIDTGQVVQMVVRPTCAERGGDSVLESCLNLTRELQEWCIARLGGPAPTAIGVSVPELVDRRGHIQSTTQFDWMTLPVHRVFNDLGTLFIESDVRAAAFAESTFGAGQNQPSALYVTVGTGISSCFLLDGRPVLGANGNALVMASGPTVVINPATDEPITHVLESVASGPALVNRFRARTSVLVERAQDVLLMADEGREPALRVVKTGAQALGNAIGNLVNVLDPDVVIVGGGLGTAPGVFWKTLQQSVRNAIWSDVSRRVPLCQGALGSSAGMVGAALSAGRYIVVPTDSDT